MIDCVAEEDVLMIVGDFNAKVGSSKRQEEDMWNEVRGCHGVGQINEVVKLSSHGVPSTVSL